MDPLILHSFHEKLGASFTDVNGNEAVADYGDPVKEHRALTESAAVLDLSFRSRLCLVGSDRVRFLHGQVTNDIKRISVGQGCYAALVTAKGRMQSDLNIYCLADELLVDFEPALGGIVTGRLEKYIVADDVQVVDVSAHYGLLSIQGPKAAGIIKQLNWHEGLPSTRFHFKRIDEPGLGESYLVNQPRLMTEGFDVFVPVGALEPALEKLVAATKSVDGAPCGWTALEMARVEAGIPRFGADMDESNLPQECGIESLAISYTKGCYIGQEVLNRLHTLGHVNRQLRGLQLADGPNKLPQKGDKLFNQGREVGIVTSAVRSSRWAKNIALAYVRRESSAAGTELTLGVGEGDSPVLVVDLPFNFA